MLLFFAWGLVLVTWPWNAWCAPSSRPDPKSVEAHLPLQGRWLRRAWAGVVGLVGAVLLVLGVLLLLVNF